MNVYEAANMLSLDIKAGQRQSIPIQSSIKAEEIDVKTAYVIPSGEKSSERGHVGANMSTAEPSHRGSDVYMSSGSRSPSPLEEDNVAEDEEDADEEDADEDNADENDVEILKNIFGHSSEICRNTLRRCHGNINTASGLLGKGCDISNMPQKRNLDRKVGFDYESLPNRLANKVLGRSKVKETQSSFFQAHGQSRRCR